jgi:hypothetical protein
MHKMTRLAALLAVTVGLTAPAFAIGPLEGADIVLDTVIAGSGPAAGAPGINLRLYDLGFLDGTGFAGVKNWVELQITTTPMLEPTPFDAPTLAGFGLSGYPTVGQVQGLGSLSTGEYATAIYLNINESAVTGFDYGKLSMLWTDDAGFPNAGANPTSMVIAKDGFSLGAPGGAFDVMITFGPGALGPDAFGPGVGISSKLAFIYNDGATNIDLDLFDAVSSGGAMPYMAAAQVWGTPGLVGFIGGTEAVLSSVPEVPEPETYAMLALGLLGVGFAVRRQAARV